MYSFPQNFKFLPDKGDFLAKIKTGSICEAKAIYNNAVQFSLDAALAERENAFGIKFTAARKAAETVQIAEEKKDDIEFTKTQLAEASEFLSNYVNQAYSALRSANGKVGTKPAEFPLEYKMRVFCDQELFKLNGIVDPNSAKISGEIDALCYDMGL